MPLYTRKQFCEAFGVSAQYISVNLKRGKLVARGKYLDSDDAENKEWIEVRREQLEDQAPSKETKPAPDVPDKPTRKKKAKIEPPDLDEDEKSVEDMKRTELDLHLKKIAVKKAQEDLELARIKKEKQLGLVIPTELVFGVFARHFKSVTDAFYQAADNILVELIPDRSDLSTARSRLVDIVNDAVEKSKEVSKKEIQALVDEYSESKGRGEKA